MRTRVRKKTGTLWPILPSIPPVPNIRRVSRQPAGASEGVEVAGGEDELQAQWVELEACMQMATLLQ